jgi:hypothetical protein
VITGFWMKGDKGMKGIKRRKIERNDNRTDK